MLEMAMVVELVLSDVAPTWACATPAEARTEREKSANATASKTVLGDLSFTAQREYTAVVNKC
jgi:hypothetical protein